MFKFLVFLLQIYPINQHEYDVHSGTKHYLVNILTRNCFSRCWDLDDIPCSHACNVLSFWSLELESYTHNFYHISNSILLYSKKTRSIGNVQQISNLYSSNDDPILPPKVKCPSERPRKKRIKSCLENKKTVP